MSQEPESEILFDQEALERFLELFASKIETEENRKKQIKKVLRACESNLGSLKLKFEILKKYQIFLKAQGFASIEQVVNANMDKILEAQNQRLAEEEEELDEDVKQFICFKLFKSNGFQYHCMRDANHKGRCSN